MPVQCTVVQNQIKVARTCSIEALEALVLVPSSSLSAGRPVHNILTTERESLIAHEAIERGCSDDSKGGASFLLLNNHLTDK